MKNIVFLASTFLVMYSCNMSDKYEKFPSGYEVDFEGGKNNRLMRNNKMVIDSGLVDCKFKDDYLLISVDTTYSMTPEKIDKKNLKFFMQNLKKDTTINKISYTDLQKLIEEKSLEDIDITK